MKRIYKVYKKTVSIVNETSTAMYENLVSTESGIPKKGFCWKVMIKIMTATRLWEWNRRRLLHRKRIVL